MTGLTGVAGCSLIEPKGQDILNLQEDFELQLFERIEPGKKQLKILVRTAQIQDCKNTEIALSSNILTNGLRLKLEDIIEPEESRCIPGKVYIQKEVPLDEFNGDRDLIVQISDLVEHNGVMSSSPLSASFYLNSTEGLKIRNNELIRIPVNLVWGTISTNDPAAINKYDEFINLLEALCEDAMLVPGYYSYFSVNNQQDISYNFGRNDRYRYDFALTYNGSISALYNLLESRRDNSLFIDITAFNGLRF